MKRYRSIDFFRGLCMIVMIGGHLFDWWLTEQDYWFFLLLKNVFGIWAATGFVFLSGVSTNMSYKRALELGNPNDASFMKRGRKLYMLRASLILLIGFIYNYAVSIGLGVGWTWIWAWLILQTIAFCIIMAWPLLKTSKSLRIILAIVFFIVNQILFILLIPYKGQFNIGGVLYHIIFNPIDQYIILSYFGVFLFGTVIGETLYDINLIKDQTERNQKLKYKMLVFLLIGVIIMTFGISYDFPMFFSYGSFPSIYYSLGLVIIVLSILILNEDLEIIITKKRYPVLSYFSYYSFTVYLGHYPLYFLFYRQLNIPLCIIAEIITGILMTFFLSIISKKVDKKASIKYGVNVLALLIFMKTEKRKKIKRKKKNLSNRKEKNLSIH